MRRGPLESVAETPVQSVTVGPPADAQAHPHTAHKLVRTGSRRLTALVALTMVGVVLVATAGPSRTLAATLAAGLLAAIVASPVLAVALPFVSAPFALREIPGAFGLQVVHIVLTLTVGVVLLGYLRGRVRRPPPSPLLWSSVFVAAMLLCTLVGEAPLRGLKVSTNHALGLAAALAAASVARQSGKWFWQILAISSVAASIVILPNISAATRAGAEFSGALITDRAQGVFAQPNDFGEFALFSVGISWALLVYRKQRMAIFLGAICLAISSAGLAVSFSRGAWLGAVAMVVVACALAPSLVRPVAIAGLGVAALFAGGALLSVPPFPLLVQRLGIGGSALVSPEDDRPIIYAQAWEVFADRPLLGLGPGTFPLTSEEPESLLVLRPYVHAHNVPLHVAAEMGLFGVAALATATVAAAICSLRAVGALRDASRAARRERRALAILSGTLAGASVHGLIDVVYTNPYLIALLWLIYGLTLGACARALDDRSNGSTRGI